jgi:trans-aconitate methyltransferase
MRERFHREYFEALYGKSEDPWEFATSEYEKRKYGHTLAALEGRRVRRGLEAGCSIGVFTAMLAPYCDDLLAVDTSERAVELARERLSSSRHARVERRTLPEEAPEGPFDLIVASEFLYYLTEDLMLATLRRFEQELAAGGSLLAVHMRKEIEIYPLQGDEVHDLLDRHTRLANVLAVTEPEYRLDLFRDAGERGRRRAQGRS